MYNMSEAEREKVLTTFFAQGLEGPITNFPSKEKRKYVIIEQLASRFTENRVYSEQEVNAILKPVYPDFVTLRRYLVDFGFLERDKAGRSYSKKKLIQGS